MNILDAVSIRLPCNACGQTYEVPLRDVLLSHTVARCGCPVTQETECPPVFQVRFIRSRTHRGSEFGLGTTCEQGSCRWR
jgi:hypothetical protein